MAVQATIVAADGSHESEPIGPGNIRTKVLKGRQERQTLMPPFHGSDRIFSNRHGLTPMATSCRPFRTKKMDRPRQQGVALVWFFIVLVLNEMVLVLVLETDRSRSSTSTAGAEYEYEY